MTFIGLPPRHPRHQQLSPQTISLKTQISISNTVNVSTKNSHIMSSSNYSFSSPEGPDFSSPFDVGESFAKLFHEHNKRTYGIVIFMATAID
ncbi:hypothetical protein TNCT_504591 [Trichonephila clavata]|uniref:Uncharacterized protein n=1 Tax=Trichonephila clavata TaxID=2740835 RepID=A0A8X6LDS2_TRICU|nr:hypothetical protein TNCT_504591 [Trichonephila clavata]